MWISLSWAPFVDLLSGSLPTGLKLECFFPLSGASHISHSSQNSWFNPNVILSLCVTSSFSTKDAESMPMNLSPPRRCYASPSAHFSVNSSQLLQWLSSHLFQQRQNTPTSASSEGFELADTSHNELQVIKPVGRRVESPIFVITDKSGTFWAACR
jgi:hypothetical protein